MKGSLFGSKKAHHKAVQSLQGALVRVDHADRTRAARTRAGVVEPEGRVDVRVVDGDGEDADDGAVVCGTGARVEAVDGFVGVVCGLAGGREGALGEE